MSLAEKKLRGRYGKMICSADNVVPQTRRNMSSSTPITMVHGSTCSTSTPQYTAALLHPPRSSRIIRRSTRRSFGPAPRREQSSSSVLCKKLLLVWVQVLHPDERPCFSFCAKNSPALHTARHPDHQSPSRVSFPSGRAQPGLLLQGNRPVSTDQMSYLKGTNFSWIYY